MEQLQIKVNGSYWDCVTIKTGDRAFVTFRLNHDQTVSFRIGFNAWHTACKGGRLDTDKPIRATVADLKTKCGSWWKQYRSQSPQRGIEQ